MKNALIFSMFVTCLACTYVPNKKANSPGEKTEISTVLNIQESIEGSFCDSANIIMPIIRIKKADISNGELLNFFKLVNSECCSDLELSAGINYWMFKLLELCPEKFLKVIKDNVDNVDLEYILMVLANPISEEVDIISTLKSLSSIEDQSPIGLKVKESLKLAIPD